MTTRAQVAAWRELADAATAGPWQAYVEADTHPRFYQVVGAGSSVCELRNPWSADDARHIAASRTAVPAMAEMLALAAASFESDERHYGLSSSGEAWLRKWRGEVDG